MARMTFYYLTHPGMCTTDGGNPVCTVDTDEGQPAVVLFTDETAAEEFRDAWVEEDGWQVGFMELAALIRWLRALPESGVPLALVDPACEGPNELTGEAFDVALLADDLAKGPTASPKPAKGPRAHGGPRRGEGRSRDR